MRCQSDADDDAPRDQSDEADPEPHTAMLPVAGGLGSRSRSAVLEGTGRFARPGVAAGFWPPFACRADDDVLGSMDR